MTTDAHISTGAMEDYAALARFHYCAGVPATHVRVLAARDGGDLAGVLVVSMPTLNGPWRARAWADWQVAPSPRAAAVELNERVRTISRVIVDPRHRGLGVAAALVRAYLTAPLTPYTEALAAMGRYVPFFAAAGMRAVPVPASQRTRAFAAALRRSGLRGWELLDLARATRVARSHPALSAAANRWMLASRATRGRIVHTTAAERLALAASWAAAAPLAFVSP